MNRWIFSFLALLLLRSIHLCRCIDEHYTACEPKSCGGGVAGTGENVTFPFFIRNVQDPFCGDLNFDVDCNARNETIINLFGFNYTIKNFYYNNNSIRVIDSDFSTDYKINDTCSIPFQNLILYGFRYRFALKYAKLVFLSNCSDKVRKDLEEYRLKGCLFKQPSEMLFAVLEETLSRVVENVTKECGKVVEVPVEMSGDEGLNLMKGSYNWWDYYENVILRRGIMLNWTATDCSVCRDSGGRCGFNQESRRFMCYCTDKPHFSDCYPKKKSIRLQLALGFGLGAVFAVGVFLIIIWCLYKKKYGLKMMSRNLSKGLNRSQSYLERGSVYYGVPVFPYCELEEATNNFDSKKELGDGGFGTVYHGVLRDGREVAVKRLYESNYKRVEQFMNEIKIITCLRHKNLVTLYGCTSRHSRELLLVYEYIPNGTVGDHLNGNLATTSSLKWPIRMSIAIETASALAYLHASDIIHRDVKTNNILLDNNFCVKVADFGLSRLFPLDVTHVSTAPQGTPGYVDPEYHQCYQLTDKSDVYSFGVVLIELISSLPAVDICRHRHEINLANLAINKITNHAYNELVDPFLGFGSDPCVEKMTIAVAELAFRCLQSDKEMRPTMDEVLENLKRIEKSGGGDSQRYNVVEVKEEEVVKVVVSGVRPPPSPENDEIVLLGKIRPPFSPISVTDRWYSTATTPSTSA